MTRRSSASAAAVNRDGRRFDPAAARSPIADRRDHIGGFTIRELARDHSVTLRALRFYESRGLLAPARYGATRIYSAREKARLALILKGKQLGFTLLEIGAMLALENKRLPDAGNAASVGGLPLSRDQVVEQLDLLRGQRSEIEGAIVELEATLGGLGTG